MKLIACILALLSAALAGPAWAATPAATSQDCRIGTYRFDDGRRLDIGATTKGLRWRMPDGTTGLLSGTGATLASTRGSTGRSDGHVVAFDACEHGTLRFDGVSARRMRFGTHDTRFEGAGVTLAGRLVLPPGTAVVPVVVLVHGSERSSALDFAAWQRMLPAQGICAFVYDKRGTGRSGGRYTQDFATLADDAAAAAREARRLAGTRMGALVYEGASQGGWVLPLAQAREPADRLIVAYGLTVSPLAENRSEVMRTLSRAGFSGRVLDEAGEVVSATERLMASGFRDGFAEYARVRRLHRAAPWYAHIDGEFSGAILRYPPWLLRLAAPLARRRSDLGTPWRHDALPPLRAIDAPVLWILAGDDSEAPPEQTRRDLAMLQAEGRPITVLDFPDTDHGIVEFETAADGTRTMTRTADGFFRAVADFARDGRLAPASYGRATRTGPPGR